MRTIARMEVIGKSTLFLIEAMEDGWIAPLYFVERAVEREDGTRGRPVPCGRNGFSTMDEAVRFGRALCMGEDIDVGAGYAPVAAGYFGPRDLPAGFDHSHRKI